MTKDSQVDIFKKDANVSTWIKDHIEELWVLLHLYQGSIVKKTFEFCSKYRREPFKDITHPIDSVTLKNLYNDFFEKLDNGTLVQIISLSDFAQIDSLLQLICFKVS